MNKKFLILAACVSSLSIAHADPLLVELNQRVEYLDSQNKDLRGAVEELTHKLNVLTQRYETFSSDVEMRLSEGAPSAAQPLAQEQTDNAPVSLTGTERPQPSILKDPATTAQIEETHQTEQNTAENLVPVALAPQNQEPQQPAINPQQQYENARSLLEQGDYIQAGNKFAEFVQNNPEDTHVPDANYWLGVSYLVRGQYESAASTFAHVYKEYPESRKAPDSLIKMAKSLSALGRKSDACTTLTQLKSAFPGKLEAQYQQEWNHLGCQ